jgi:AcrR family transcriptional regulator
MRGRKPVRPLTEVADAAVGVFTDKGFRSAGISDVSAALGLSHGALYTYVDSKQALLYLALLRAVQPEAVNTLAIPVTAPPPQEVVALVKAWAAGQAETAWPAAARSSGYPATRLIDQELGGIIDALYGFIEGHRQVLKLVARCAADLPELAQWYFVQQRRAMLEQLGGYLRQRIRTGELSPVPDVPAAARFIVETIAWFAMHRYGDPDSAMLDDDACRRTVRHLLLAAFLPVTSETASQDGGHQQNREC